MLLYLIIGITGGTEQQARSVVRLDVEGVLSCLGRYKVAGHPGYVVVPRGLCEVRLVDVTGSVVCRTAV